MQNTEQVNRFHTVPVILVTRRHRRERERESLFMDSLVGRLVQVGVAYLCPHIPYEIDTTRAVLREPI